MGGKHLPMFLCFCSGKTLFCGGFVGFALHQNFFCMIPKCFPFFKNELTPADDGCPFKCKSFWTYKYCRTYRSFFLNPKMDGRSPKELFQQILYRYRRQRWKTLFSFCLAKYFFYTWDNWGPDLCYGGPWRQPPPPSIYIQSFFRIMWKSLELKFIHILCMNKFCIPVLLMSVYSLS